MVQSSSTSRNGTAGFGTPFEVAWSALAERIHPTQKVAKNSGSPCVPVGPRWGSAPSAVFCLAPVPLLAGAYTIACLVLWAGWRMFLPGIEFAFWCENPWICKPLFPGRQVLLLGCPRPCRLVASKSSLIRLRVKAFWLTIGLLLVAWTGSTARIDANRATAHGALDTSGCPSTFSH